MLSGAFIDIMRFISGWSIPALLVFVPLYAHWRKVPVYECFVAGAEEGVRTAVRILPYLMAMWVALALVRSSGLLDIVLGWCAPVLAAVGVPQEVLPLAIIRPLSGSAGLSIMTELLRTHGPDSPVGLLASVLQSSTETTFYVLTVYLGAVGIRKIRHTIAAGLIGDVVGFIAAVLIWRAMFC